MMFSIMSSVMHIASAPILVRLWILLSTSSSTIPSDELTHLPMMAPKAMAIGRPSIPVPGMPTPIAFFKIFALSNASIFSGRQPNLSVAFAVHNATHRFGTANGWHNLAMNHRYDTFS